MFACMSKSYKWFIAWECHKWRLQECSIMTTLDIELFCDGKRRRNSIPPHQRKQTSIIAPRPKRSISCADWLFACNQGCKLLFWGVIGWNTVILQKKTGFETLWREKSNGSHLVTLKTWINWAIELSAPQSYLQKNNWERNGNWYVLLGFTTNLGVGSCKRSSVDYFSQYNTGQNSGNLKNSIFRTNKRILFFSIFIDHKTAGITHCQKVLLWTL